MSDNGHDADRQSAVKRYSGGLRCRPVAGAAADAGPEDWRFDILRASGGIAAAEVAGEIDLRTGGILRKRLFELGDAGFGRIVIDFDNVRFCDAAGLGVLVAAHNKLRGQGGAVSLARVRPAQRRLLRVAGLETLFTLYDSVSDAVSAQRSAVRTRQKPNIAPLS